jgi:YHS domain-containing protein
MLLHNTPGLHRVSPAMTACLAFACWCPAIAGAASPWHADLAAARTAAVASQRPVLALFVASWSEESRAVATALQADAEVNALLSTCFEPVVLDVDGNQELTRRLEISHVPTAVALDAGDRKLAAFECPNAMPAFIAAAAGAARDVAARSSAAGAANRAEGATPLATATDASPTRGSISMLTAKVRQLSSFAADGGRAAAGEIAPSAALPAAFAGEQVSAVQEPTLPRVPPTWSAERPIAPLALAPAASQPRPTIEPVAQGVASTTPPAAGSTPWLAAAATSEPESTASVSDLPAAGSASATQKSDAKTSNSFLAAIQKPFAGLVRKPEAAVVKPEPPPTMPPARPQWPGALAATTPTAPAAPASPPTAVAPATPMPAPAAEATMPLGLEGYCPVTLAEKQVWTEGRPQYGARHRGRTYLFAGPEQQRAFLADPDRYAPALSGDDPVLAFEQGKSMPGQRRYGVVCQSRMFLFATPETRDAFAANPEKYAGRVAMAEQRATASTRTY